MTWPMVALGDVATVERVSVQPSHIAGDTWYLGLEHIESGGEIVGRLSASAAELKSSKFRFDSGHILYGKLRPYLAKIATPDFDGVCSTDILPVRPGTRMDRRYLAHYLRQEGIVGLASSRATGANLPRLSPSELEKLPVPMPPLDEQRRIAAILDQADAIRAKRQDSLEFLRALKGSLGPYLMRGAATQSVPLGDLVSSFQIGLDRKVDGQSAEHGFDYLKMDSISKRGDLDLSRVVKVEATVSELHKYALEDGDLMFNTRNSRELVGKSAIYRGEPRLFNNNIMRIRLLDPFLVHYVHSFLWSRSGRGQLEAAKSGTTSVFAIYAKDLMKVKVPMPIDGTSRLSQLNSSVHLIEREVERVVSALGADDALFASLQSRAFKGEL